MCPLLRVAGWIMPPAPSAPKYIYVPISRTRECQLLWQKELCRCDWVKDPGMGDYLGGFVVIAGSLWRDGRGICVRKDNVMMEAEMDAVCFEGGGPQAKACRQSPELRKAGKRILPRASWRNELCQHSDFNSVTSDLPHSKRTNGCCFKPLSCRHLLQQQWWAATLCKNILGA